MEYLAAVECSSMKATRPLAYFRPSVWGDRFLNHTPPPQETLLQREQEHNNLKEEVRKKLHLTSNDPKQRIMYIDAIEQLGVAYHFEEEIEAILTQFYDNYDEYIDRYVNDIHYISLKFRILRQHGFRVTSGIFEKFKDDGNDFMESLSRDVHGLLNLYEASYLRVCGEKILDEALEFTTFQLKSIVGTLSEAMAKQMNEALKFPIHKSMVRLSSRYYIGNYESNPSHDKTLLRFAKIDFNMLQSLHLNELQDLSRWWEKLNLCTKLPFARNRIVEIYFWGLGTFYEPQYAYGRSIFTKVIKLLSIIDDVYDAYGLFEELKLYTEAVNKWDKIYINQLPDYMKPLYEKLIDTFEELEKQFAKDGRSHLISYVEELMKAQCEAYLQEAKWLNDKYVPKYDEYMENAALTTSGYTLLFAMAFLGMGNLATKEAFEWLTQSPKLVKASNIIGRIMNDIVGHKLEQRRNHVASSVECYMAEYGVSEEEALKELYKKVEEAWKDQNEEMLRPTQMPRPLFTIILNLSRVIHMYYGLGDDEYTLVTQNTCNKIQAVLIHPIID